MEPTRGRSAGEHGFRLEYRRVRPEEPEVVRYPVNQPRVGVPRAKTIHEHEARRALEHDQVGCSDDRPKPRQRERAVGPEERARQGVHRRWEAI